MTATQNQPRTPATEPDRSLDTTGPGVVSAAGARRALAERLRRAVGFRVDGPEGRIGVLRAVEPTDGEPARIRVATGLFIVRVVPISVADVTRVDLRQRRVHVRVVPAQRRASRRALALGVRPYVRTRRP